MVNQVAEPTTVRAIVRSLDGNRAFVEVEQGGCGRCHEEGGCGGQQLTQMFCSGPKSYLADNFVQAGVGDRVVVAIAAGSVRRSANLAYILPLTVTIGGAIVGSSINGDLGGILGAVAGFFGALGIIRYKKMSESADALNRPHIISRA